MQRRFQNLFCVPVMFVVVSVLVILAAGAGQLYASDNSMDQAYLPILIEAVNEMQKNYVEPLPFSRILESAVKGIADPEDPYTVLLPPDRFQALQQNAKGALGGVGLYLIRQKKEVVVAGVVLGGPADLAGLKIRDRILAIDGELLRTLTEQEVGVRLRGAPGTVVRIVYEPVQTETPVEVRLTRRMVKKEQVRFGMADPEGVGYMAVFQFSGNTLEQVVNGLEELEASDTGLKGLVLDLRNNPGGQVEQAVAVADLFIDDGPIVSIRGRHKDQEKTYNAHPSNIRRTYPIVVLINAGSVSAAEILAGALKDRKRALIAGTQSYGKGSVQRVVSLSGGYGLKYTIAKYFTPSGSQIDGIGITPDMPIPEDGEDSGAAVRAALEILKGLQD